MLEQHKKLLFRVAQVYCPDAASREDLVQEIVMQLWSAYPRFDGRCRVTTWMYRIALNVAISFYRRETVRTRVVRGEDDRRLEMLAAPEPESEPVRLLHEAIGRLDPLNKALVLLYLEGHNHQEIGQVLGLSETNVATKLGRLKQRMAQEMASGKKEGQG